jgi:LAO/AO transport system kinase
VLWGKIREHRDALSGSGELDKRRQRQAVAWMHDMLGDRIMARVHSHPRVAKRLPELEAEVREGRLLPTLAVDEVLELAGFNG